MSSIGSGLGFSSSLFQSAASASSAAADSTGQAQIAAKAKQALAKGVQDGGQVDDYKPKSDLTGASGDNDYWSALGYDA